MTDSRVTWGTPDQAWAYGRKTFASSRTADVLGYCGDVLFPSLVISQFVAALESGFYSPDFASRHHGLQTLLRTSFSELPQNARHPFSIVHVGRDGKGMASVFQARLIRWDDGWDVRELELPEHQSGVVHIDGSGRPSIEQQIAAAEVNSTAGTTRGLFTAFAKSLSDGDDPLSGGPPQLVGLFRIRAGLSFGVVHEGDRFFYGMPVHHLGASQEPEWRNDKFEIVDSSTRKRRESAARHTDV